MCAHRPRLATIAAVHLAIRSSPERQLRDGTHTIDNAPCGTGFDHPAFCKKPPDKGALDMNSKAGPGSSAPQSNMCSAPSLRHAFSAVLGRGLGTRLRDLDSLLTRPGSRSRDPVRGPAILWNAAVGIELLEQESLGNRGTGSGQVEASINSPSAAGSQ